MLGAAVLKKTRVEWPIGIVAFWKALALKVAVSNKHFGSALTNCNGYSRKQAGKDHKKTLKHCSSFPPTHINPQRFRVEGFRFVPPASGKTLFVVQLRCPKAQFARSLNGSRRLRGASVAPCALSNRHNESPD